MEMVFIHEKGANSILPKSGPKYLVAVTPFNCFKRFYWIVSNLASSIMYQISSHSCDSGYFKSNIKM